MLIMRSVGGFGSAGSSGSGTPESGVVVVLELEEPALVELLVVMVPCLGGSAVSGALSLP